MQVLDTILTFLLFVVLPCFLVWKLFRTLSGNMRAGRQQKELIAAKLCAYIDRKCLVLDEELEMYRAQKEKDSRREQKADRVRKRESERSQNPGRDRAHNTDRRDGNGSHKERDNGAS